MALKSIFARHGIPDEVVSDKGPQFACAEFRNFAKVWEFQHTTSSPGYPQSNEQVERTVQTVKNLLQKAHESGQDPYLSILEYRNNTLDSVKKSPAQLLMSRRLKSLLPTTSTLLQPQVAENVAKELRSRQQIQKKYYDIGSRVLSSLHKGEVARMQRQGKWVQVTVVGQHDGTPRSYLVQTQDGQIYRRNRRHLLKTNESRQDLQEFNDDAEEDTSQIKHGLEMEHLPVEEEKCTHTEKNQTTRYGRLIRKPQRYGVDSD